MPIIESVSVCIASVPLDQPVRFSTRQVTAREYALIRVRSTDGYEGLGVLIIEHAQTQELKLGDADLTVEPPPYSLASDS